MNTLYTSMQGFVKTFFVANSYRIVYISFMPTEKPKIILVMEKDLLKRIEDFRFENRISSRSKAIRRLLEKALSPYAKQDKKAKK